MFMTNLTARGNWDLCEKNETIILILFLIPYKDTLLCYLKR